MIDPALLFGPASNRRAGVSRAYNSCITVIAVGALAFSLAGCGGRGAQTVIPATGSASRSRVTQSVGGFSIADATSGSTFVAPLALAWPKGAPNSGDLLIACTESQWANAPVSPAGWTSLFTSKSAFGTALFYKIAGSTEAATVSFTIPTAYNIGAAMVRITGAAAVAPLWSHVQNSAKASITTTGLVPNVLGMLPLACVSGVNAGSYALAAGSVTDTQTGAGYSTSFGHLSAPSTDTTTAISVAATAANATKTYQSDAYGLLVAPAAGSTATPTPTPPPTTPSALSVVDKASGGTYAAPLSLTWPKGAPASGDLLIACAESQWANTPTTPTGWTSLFSANGSFGTALFYKVATSAETPAVTFTIPTAFNVSAAMVRISGAMPTAPQWSQAENFGAATIATKTIVPSVLGMLPVACFGGVNAGSFSVATGWTADTQSSVTYVDAVEHTALTSDTSTPISVTAGASNGASTYQNDAYGLLVAPAAASSGGVGLNPASIAFLGIAVPAQSVVATQTGNAAFSATSANCTGVATITATGNAGFSIAPVGAGSCTFTITGANGAATLPVTVTTTTIVSQ